MSYRLKSERGGWRGVERENGDVAWFGGTGYLGMLRILNAFIEGKAKESRYIWTAPGAKREQNDKMPLGESNEH